MNEPSIIFEDKNLLALDKPSGWVVNDATTVQGRQTLQSWIKDNLKFPISNDKLLRSGIVHRLDKPTSGIILVAKTKEVYEALQKEFFNREVKKTYIALVHGRVEDSKGVINAPVGRLPWKRTKFGVFPEGRPAITNYKVTGYYSLSSNPFTILELYPKTGRTHQLRVHLKHIGHPVVADPLYAGRKTLREDLKTFPRLFLHAKSIEFVHPVTKKVIKLESPFPPDLASALEQLKS